MAVATPAASLTLTAGGGVGGTSSFCRALIVWLCGQNVQRLQCSSSGVCHLVARHRKTLCRQLSVGKCVWSEREREGCDAVVWASSLSIADNDNDGAVNSDSSSARCSCPSNAVTCGCSWKLQQAAGQEQQQQQQPARCSFSGNQLAIKLQIKRQMSFGNMQPQSQSQPEPELQQHPLLSAISGYNNYA